MTLDRLRELAKDLRCEVTLDRCSQWGCANDGATVMPPEWRCPSCAVYWEIQSETVEDAFLHEHVSIVGTDTCVDCGARYDDDTDQWVR